MERIGEETPRAAVLGDVAEGTIGAGEVLPERFGEFVERVAGGDFHVPVPQVYPAGCVDGRCGDDELAPNTAGGVALTALVADALTAGRFQNETHDTCSALAQAIDFLRRKDVPIAGHTDDHAHGKASGCGANDKLPMIFNLLQRKGDAVRGIVESLGVAVDDDTHQHLITNAQQPREFDTVREVFEQLRKADGAHIATLRGGHQEVMAVINLREGTTLDRTALATEFGEQLQSFNVDVWALKNLAEVLADGSDDGSANQLFRAMLYYNVATTLVLADSSLRVAVLR